MMLMIMFNDEFFYCGQGIEMEVGQEKKKQMKWKILKG